MSNVHYHETMLLGGERITIFVSTIIPGKVKVSAVFGRDGMKFENLSSWPLGKPRTESALAEIICDVEDMAVQCEEAIRSNAVSAFAVMRVAIKETLRLLHEAE